MDQDQIWAQINRTSDIIQKEFKKGLKVLRAKEKSKPSENVEREVKIDEETSEKHEENEPVQPDNLEESMKEDHSSADSPEKRSDEAKIDYEDLENYLDEAENKDV